MKCFSHPFSLQWQNKFCSAIKLPKSLSWGWWGGGICQCCTIISVKAKMSHEYIEESEKLTGSWVKWFQWLLRGREREDWGWCPAFSCPWEGSGSTLGLFHLVKITRDEEVKNGASIPLWFVSSQLRYYLPGQLSLEESHPSLGWHFFSSLRQGPWFWSSVCGKANKQDWCRFSFKWI